MQPIPPLFSLQGVNVSQDDKIEKWLTGWIQSDLRTVLSKHSGTIPWAELMILTQMLLLVSFIDLSFTTTQLLLAANLGISQVTIWVTNKEKNKH